MDLVVVAVAQPLGGPLDVATVLDAVAISPLVRPLSPLRTTRRRDQMSPLEFALLVVAGVGAGLTGSVAGLASLVSYPALLAAGVPPLTANMTNTVALVLNGVGSVSASGPELKGQEPRVLRLDEQVLSGCRAEGRCRRGRRVLRLGV